MTQTDEPETVERCNPKPDGDKAFHIADELQEDLRTIGCLADSLKLIAKGMENKLDHNGLYGIADGIEAFFNKAEEKREQIFHLTWGYAHPGRDAG